MGTTENIETFGKWIEAHQNHDLDKLVDFLTDDVKIQSAAGGNMPPAKGKDEARHHWQSIYTAFPDFLMEAVDVTADGDTLFAEISHGGTMEGQMGPFQPTGESYRTQGAFRFDFSDGKICSILSYWDTAAMMKQLSVAA